MLARAKVERDELLAAARKIPLNLTAEQVALLPATLAMIREVDPVLQAALLAEAAERRDVLVVGAFLNAPRTKSLALAVSDEQLDAARGTFAGGDADRNTLARMRQLISAAETSRRALIDDMRAAAGLGPRDPIAALAAGEPAEAAA